MELKIKNNEIKWLGHDGFFIKNKESNIIIYVDPYKINNVDEEEKADFVFITHGHYDHCSIEDINKIVNLKKLTIIVCTADVQSKLRHIEKGIELKIVKPNQEIKIKELNIKVFPAYNTNKNFHPKEEDWAGYIIRINDFCFYHAGDTDLIPEMKSLAKENIDVAFLPVSGTYVMTAKEAAEAASIIQPKLTVPMHYGEIVGSKNDAERFKELCKEKNINCFIF